MTTKLFVAALCLSVAAGAADLDSSLVKAVLKDDLKEAAALLEKGASANATYKRTDPVLMVAMMRSNTPMAELLLEKGADPNAPNREGITPLMMSGFSLFSYRRLVGDSAIESNSSVSYRKSPLTDTLLAKGANVYARDVDGKTALMYAAGIGAVDKMQALLAKSAQVDLADKNGATPLMAAASYGDPSAVRFLLDHGADPAHKDKKGAAASAYARKDSYLAELLRRAAVERSVRTLEVPAEWMRSPDPAKALVYIWREYFFEGSGRHPSVYCDNVQLASTEAGKWFAMQIAPGKHDLRLDRPNGPVFPIEVQANRVYHLRIDNPWVGPVVFVPDDEGWFEITHRQPIDAKRVIAPGIATIKP